MSFGIRSARADLYHCWKGGWVEPLTPTPPARCTTVRVLERGCLSPGQQVCPLSISSDTEVRKVRGRKVSTEASARIQVQTDKGLAQNCFCKNLLKRTNSDHHWKETITTALNTAIKKQTNKTPPAYLAGSIGKRFVDALNGHSGVQKFGEMAELPVSHREFCIVAGGRSKSTIPAMAFYPSPLNSLPRELAVLMGLFVSFVKLGISGLLYSFLTSR